MGWLLNSIYVCFLALASPWLLWRFLVNGKNRRGWSHKVFGLVKLRESPSPCIWLHAVSVGEVNLLAPILREFQQRHPDHEFVISTTTETGFDLACKKFPEHYTFFCPLDFTWAITRVLKRLRPRILVLAELEIWPNLIQTTRSTGIPVAVINGRLSAGSFRGYHRFRWLIGVSFRQLSAIAAQNETYAERFRQLGCHPSKVVVTGSVKFDGVETNRVNSLTQQLVKVAEIGPNDQVFVAGSTQAEEDLMAALVYRELVPTYPDLRLILVPRHPGRCGSLVHRLKQMGIPSLLRSRLDARANPSSDSTPVGGIGCHGQEAEGAMRSVLIVDVIGELGAWWGLADAAYVGGSLGRRGGQNMIEPAAFGLPVSFGPNTENFRDIVQELLEHQAAQVIYDQATLREFVEQALRRSEGAVEMGVRAQQVVMNHQGASHRTVEVLFDTIEASGRLSDDAATASTRAA